MSLAYETETARMMLDWSRQEHTVATAHGFELRPTSSVMPDLVELFADPIWETGAVLLKRRITGFAVVSFPLRIPKQPVSDWIFIKAHKPLPTAEQLLLYAIRRVVLLRYLRTGVSINFFNRRAVVARAGRFRDGLWERNFRNEVA